MTVLYSASGSLRSAVRGKVVSVYSFLSRQKDGLLVRFRGTRIDSSPGATSEVTSSISYEDGRDYIVAVSCYRQASLDPDTPSLSGLGVSSWETVHDILWTSTGTTRRRMTVFKGRATSSGTGAATISYTNAPDMIAAQIVECAAGSGTIVQHVDTGSFFLANGTFYEVPFGLVSSPGKSTNRLLFFFAGNANVSATMRAELASDSSGDVDWTTLEVSGLTTSPAICVMSAFYDGNPSDDLRPGVIQTTGGPTCCIVVLEVEAIQ